MIFNNEVTLIPADGKGKRGNFTGSGYGADSPKWMMNDKLMIWFAGRNGTKNHGSWGGKGDVYGMFFTKAARDRFKLRKEDYAVLRERENGQEAAKTGEAAKKEEGRKRRKLLRSSRVGLTRDKAA